MNPRRKLLAAFAGCLLDAPLGSIAQGTRGAFGLRHRLPMVSGWSAYADSGFLMTYGPNLRDSYAHLATYVDKILKGAKPADLPVELPTSVEFVINARTAKAIGVKVPQAMRLRAQTVIE